MTKKLLLDQPDDIVVFVFDGCGQPASANVLDLRSIEQLGRVRRMMVRVLVTRERLVPTDDPAWGGDSWRDQSSAPRFLHERADLCLFGGGQLLQREGGGPH